MQDPNGFESLLLSSEAFGAYVRRAREAAQMTQEEAHEYLIRQDVDISFRSFQAYDRGDRLPRSQAVARKILRYMDLKAGKDVRYPPGEDLTVHEVKEPPDSEMVHELPVLSFKASAGDGRFATEREVRGSYLIDVSQLRQGFTPQGKFGVEVVGDSMTPEFAPGELVIFEAVNGGRLIPVDGVYLFRHYDMIQIKRLQRRSQHMLYIMSHNPDYPDYELEVDEGMDFEILGKVWGKLKRY